MNAPTPPKLQNAPLEIVKWILEQKDKPFRPKPSKPLTTTPKRV